MRLTVASLPLALFLAGVALAQSPALPPVPPTGSSPRPPTPQALARDVWLIPGGMPDKRQPDGNSVIFKGTTGLVVLDTGRHRWHRQAILDLAKAADLPVSIVVNSHWHLDHVSGNPDIQAAYPAAKVYASDAMDGALEGFLKDSAIGAHEILKSPGLPPETVEDIRDDLATMESGSALRPDTVVKTSSRLVLAGRPMDVNLSIDGPTAGDVWLYDSETRVAAVGDLVTLPVPFLDTACVAGWKSALIAVSETPFELLIPGHGKPMSRSEFDQYRSAFGRFLDCSSSARAKGECAADWVKDVSALLEANEMNLAQARGMAAYYIGEVLRPNGGNSKFCKARR